MCPLSPATDVIDPTFMSQDFLPYVVKGPGFDSTSPANISSSFLQGAVRREEACSPTVLPPPLPLDTHSEEERRETTVEGKMKLFIFDKPSIMIM